MTLFGPPHAEKIPLCRLQYTKKNFHLNLENIYKPQITMNVMKIIVNPLLFNCRVSTDL